MNNMEKIEHRCFVNIFPVGEKWGCIKCHKKFKRILGLPRYTIIISYSMLLGGLFSFVFGWLMNANELSMVYSIMCLIGFFVFLYGSSYLAHHFQKDVYHYKEIVSESEQTGSD